MSSDALSESAVTEARQLLQNRVLVLSKILFALNLGVVVLDVLGQIAYGMALGAILKEAIAGMVATAVSGSLWLVCRNKVLHQVRFIRSVEAAALFLSCAALAMMGRYAGATTYASILSQVPQIGASSYVESEVALLLQRWIMLGATFIASLLLVIRSAIVPSRTLWSATVTMTSGLPLFLILGMGLPLLKADGRLAALTPWSARVDLTVYLVSYWSFAVAACAFISRVIHHLRKEAQRARQLGQYTLDEKLGEGGMGTVYRAHHALLRRPTAIKLLPPEKAGTEALARFEREVQLTTRLTHPNTITIYDYGRTSDGVLYYAMELLDGADLETVVEVSGAMPAGRVIRILTMVAGALGEAHQVGLIHRDIKPANIYLSRLGGDHDVAKVLDFGLVKETVRTEASTLTQEGRITGTPLYMSPESLSSPEDADARADIYALGAVGYFLLTAQHVFTGKSAIEICSHHLQSRPVPPMERLGSPVPADLETIILQCLEKEPGKRPQTALQLRMLLLACTEAGSWGEDQARAWWEHKGPELRKRTTAEAFASTMAVDLKRT